MRGSAAGRRAYLSCWSLQHRRRLSERVREEPVCERFLIQGGGSPGVSAMSGKVAMTDEYINEDGPKKVFAAQNLLFRH